LHAVHGVDVRTVRGPVSPAGRTDGEIARAILVGAGVSAARIDDLADAVRVRCCKEHARLCPSDLSHTVLPGVRELLEWLTAREHAKLGLLSGNYEPIGRLKLARAGIGQYFPSGQGAFGSDSEDRSSLPAIARRRAGRRGLPYPREQTIVIGDTPRDIACARADEVRCFALTTGPYGADELAGADLVVANAFDLREALERSITPSAWGTGCASSDPKPGRG
jgi:phosphoglycolate phosphatase-like HAD superfamily hydrolase